MGWLVLLNYSYVRQGRAEPVVASAPTTYAVVSFL